MATIVTPTLRSLSIGILPDLHLSIHAYLPSADEDQLRARQITCSVTLHNSCHLSRVQSARSRVNQEYYSSIQRQSLKLYYCSRLYPLRSTLAVTFKFIRRFLPPNNSYVRLVYTSGILGFFGIINTSDLRISKSMLHSA
jgi:hypothetical protein